ncbi:efflux transporter outer membrane subunit [Sphingomonas yantingensis]|uniref:NodT family efflux transporter outer membrane factor (OMF) lipoprotein n=1 Tax=Sphingomonas yantingensis TaxID=1241761 RepID=A0A7W9EGP8_9SPHN|nr:efflux transporter outer membrane subunit [Sphingomonas yantingensis]MBB5697348.1 NodT family efflux transporter outer membrane factor (OMF) lipoprotein [Sphingomonas yantingensis]
MRKLIPLVSLAALAACTVGPNYEGPKSAGAVAAPAAFARAGQTSTAQPVVADWWRGLNDAALDALVERALKDNPSIAVAEARLRQARSALRLDKANGLPNANVQGTYLRAELPNGGLTGGTADGGTQGIDFYNVGFDASWEIDLFGGQKRRVEAARAGVGAAEAQVADAQVSLTAEVASAYVNLRDRQRRLELGRATAETRRRILALTEQRFRAGTASQLDVERIRGLVVESDAAIVPIDAERDAYLNALAVLVGEAPGTLDAELSAPRPVPLPPARVDVGDPAQLLERRPDVRAAERVLAQRTAQIGLTKAAAMPRISFLGLIGIGGTKPGDLFDLGNLAGIAVPRLQWNALDFGRNGARLGQAEGQRDEAAAQYRGAVLTALRDAEDALSRYAARRASVAAAARSKATADRAAALMQQRYRAGVATLIDTLDAERQRTAAEQSVVQATAVMTADYVALQKALGLGWRT